MNHPATLQVNWIGIVPHIQTYCGHKHSSLCTQGVLAEALIGLCRHSQASARLEGTPNYHVVLIRSHASQVDVDVWIVASFVPSAVSATNWTTKPTDPWLEFHVKRTPAASALITTLHGRKTVSDYTICWYYVHLWILHGNVSLKSDIPMYLYVFKWTCKRQSRCLV